MLYNKTNKDNYLGQAFLIVASLDLLLNPRLRPPPIPLPSEVNLPVAHGTSSSGAYVCALRSSIEASVPPFPLPLSFPLPLPGSMVDLWALDGALDLDDRAIMAPSAVSGDGSMRKRTDVSLMLLSLRTMGGGMRRCDAAAELVGDWSVLESG